MRHQRAELRRFHAPRVLRQNRINNAESRRTGDADDARGILVNELFDRADVNGIALVQPCLAHLYSGKFSAFSND